MRTKSEVIVIIVEGKLVVDGELGFRLQCTKSKNQCRRMVRLMIKDIVNKIRFLNH